MYNTFIHYGYPHVVTTSIMYIHSYPVYIHGGMYNRWAVIYSGVYNQWGNNNNTLKCIGVYKAYGIKDGG